MRTLAVCAVLALSTLSGAALAQTPPPGGGLRAADTNGDGNITRAEFDASNAARFDRQDADHNGSLSQAERTPPASAGGPPPGGPPPGGGAGGPPPGMTNPDTNGDGAVSRAEFDAASAARFTRMDANSDGTIQASELPTPGGPR